MGEDKTTNIHVHEDPLAEEAEVEEEESLSLCDLPLDLDPKNNPPNDPLQNLKQTRTRKSSSEAAAPEFFEFFNENNNNNSSSDMCPADDIISGGKLIPLRETSRNPVLRKRSESLSEVRINAQIKAGLLWNSRSLDSQKQKLNRSDMAERNIFLTKSFEQRVVKRPGWFVFMFGTAKFPPEMELKDIKSRQSRRNPSVMFPDDGKKVADNRSSDKSSSSWGLLKALSCRDFTSVAVTSSFYLPQA